MRILKALLITLFALAIGAACAIGFVSELGRMAWWEYVAYPVVVLLCVAGAIGAWLRDEPEPKPGIVVRGANTVEVDGVQMTVHQVALMKALERAAQEPGGDVVIGTDPSTGQVSYRVIRR
jgi:hypothetical protein